MSHEAAHVFDTKTITRPPGPRQFHAVNGGPAIVIMWANQPVAVHGNSSQIIPRPKQEHNNAI